MGVVNIFYRCINARFELIIQMRINLFKDNHNTGGFKVTSHSSGGRPQFNVTRKQLERLSSLNFTWVQIASLWGNNSNLKSNRGKSLVDYIPIKIYLQ